MVNAEGVKILGDEGLILLESLLVYDPAGRMSAKQAVQHPYFEENNGQFIRGPNGYNC
jgi:cyclin-dependent kinase